MCQQLWCSLLPDLCQDTPPHSESIGNTMINSPSRAKAISMAHSSFSTQIYPASAAGRSGRHWALWMGQPMHASRAPHERPGPWMLQQQTRIFALNHMPYTNQTISVYAASTDARLQPNSLHIGHLGTFGADAGIIESITKACVLRITSSSRSFPSSNCPGRRHQPVSAAGATALRTFNTSRMCKWPLSIGRPSILQRWCRVASLFPRGRTELRRLQTQAVGLPAVLLPVSPSPRPALARCHSFRIQTATISISNTGVCSAASSTRTGSISRRRCTAQPAVRPPRTARLMPRLMLRLHFAQAGVKIAGGG